MMVRALRQLLKQGVFQLLRGLGHDMDTISLSGALQRCQQRGLRVQTVIDVGASDGRWSLECMRYFPAAHYLLLDAQQLHEAALKAFTTQHPKTAYQITAVGDADGPIHFDASDPFGGIAAYSPFAKNDVIVPMHSLATLVQTHGVMGPFVIKLDTHGFEVPILQGAQSLLPHTELIVVEVYNFNFSAANLRFVEMCQHLEKLGFRCVDICDPLHRPKDGALWQFDAFFIPATNPIFRDNQYHASPA